jgi:hypothetical protein
MYVHNQIISKFYFCLLGLMHLSPNSCLKNLIIHGLSVTSVVF